MAVRGATVVTSQRRVKVITWLGLLQSSSDTGAPVSMAENADKSIQVVGDFGVAGAITLQGSHDGGVTYSVLHDPQGVDLVILDSEFRLIAENPLLIRPFASAGDGDTDLDVVINATQNGT